mmetsp:Transcript_1663/g.2307  ORF Transcript_1663/g.2307 Transcript_1663/m.2307 type:complete len:314 (-) Transcript_1663:794-1735(-)
MFKDSLSSFCAVVSSAFSSLSTDLLALASIFSSFPASLSLKMPPRLLIKEVFFFFFFTFLESTLASPSLSSPLTSAPSTDSEAPSLSPIWSSVLFPLFGRASLSPRSMLSSCDSSLEPPFSLLLPFDSSSASSPRSVASSLLLAALSAAVSFPSSWVKSSAFSLPLLDFLSDAPRIDSAFLALESLAPLLCCSEGSLLPLLFVGSSLSSTFPSPSATDSVLSSFLSACTTSGLERLRSSSSFSTFCTSSVGLFFDFLSTAAPRIDDFFFLAVESSSAYSPCSEVSAVLLPMISLSAFSPGSDASLLPSIFFRV